MKSNLFIFLTVLLILQGFLNCKNEPELIQISVPGLDKIQDESDQSRWKFGLITGMGGLGDKSYNDMLFRGMVLSKKELGIDFAYRTPLSPAENLTLIEELISEGCNAIIEGSGWYGQEPVDILSEKYPEILFILVDDFALNYRHNVCSVTFRQNEGSFLAGILASLFSKTRNIAVVAASDVEVINDFIVGFVAGAEYADSEKKVFIEYIDVFSDKPDPFQNPEAAYLIAEDLITTNNVDVIYHISAGSGMGVFNAAKAHGRFAIGVDADQDYLAQGTILTSMMKNIDTGIMQIIGSIINDTFDNRPYILGLAEKGVSLSPMIYTADIIGGEILDIIKEAEKKIIDGEIKVPTVY